MFGNTIITPAMLGGSAGLAYGAVQHYGKDRYDVNIGQTTASGLMVGGAIGAMALGVRLKTGKLTNAFDDTVTIDGKTVSGDAAKILKGFKVGVA